MPGPLADAGTACVSRFAFDDEAPAEVDRGRFDDDDDEDAADMGG